MPAGPSPGPHALVPVVSLPSHGAGSLTSARSSVAEDGVGEGAVFPSSAQGVTGRHHAVQEVSITRSSQVACLTVAALNWGCRSKNEGCTVHLLLLKLCGKYR